MKSLKANFRKTKRLNPRWSDYICFTHIIKGKCFDNQIVKKNFENLVNPDNYDKSNKKNILKNLYRLNVTKPTEESSFGGSKSS